MSGIGLIATLRVKSGKESEFEAAFAELATAVRANEPGNHYYRLFRAADAGGLYRVMECYADEAALDAHKASDHVRSLSARIGPCLDGALSIERLDAV